MEQSCTQARRKQGSNRRHPTKVLVHLQRRSKHLAADPRRLRRNGRRLFARPAGKRIRKPEIARGGTSVPGLQCLPGAKSTRLGSVPETPTEAPPYFCDPHPHLHKTTFFTF